MPTVGFGTIILAVSFDCIITLTVFAIFNIPTAVFYTLPLIAFYSFPHPVAFYTLPLISFYTPPLVAFYNLLPPAAFFYTPPRHSPSAAFYTPPPSYTAPTVPSHTLQPAASDIPDTAKILFSSSPTIPPPQAVIPLPQAVISTNFNTIVVFVTLLHTIAVIADV
jgi:hypothetical protein